MLFVWVACGNYNFHFVVQPCAVQGQINDLVHWIRHIFLFGVFSFHLCQNNAFILIT